MKDKTKCQDCEVPIDESNQVFDGNGRKRIRCKTCQKKLNVINRKNFLEKHPGYERKVQLKRHFGITEFEYNQLYALQTGGCAICK